MGFLGGLGKALGKPLKAPGMGLITKPVNKLMSKTPGMRGIPGRLGMGGPSKERTPIGPTPGGQQNMMGTATPRMQMQPKPAFDPSTAPTQNYWGSNNLSEGGINPRGMYTGGPGSLNLNNNNSTGNIFASQEAPEEVPGVEEMNQRQAPPLQAPAPDMSLLNERLKQRGGGFTGGMPWQRNQGGLGPRNLFS